MKLETHPGFIYAVDIVIIVAACNEDHYGLVRD